MFIKRKNKFKNSVNEKIELNESVEKTECNHNDPLPSCKGVYCLACKYCLIRYEEGVPNALGCLKEVPCSGFEFKSQYADNNGCNRDNGRNCIW